VYSGASFSVIRDWFEAAAELLRSARPELTLINATEGGARLAGFQERTLAGVLSTLPEQRITASDIAARAGEIAAPIPRNAIVSWLRGQSEKTAAARRAARRVRKIGEHALGAIRADDPLGVTRSFDALDQEENALRDRVRDAPFLDAWCHAAIERVMTRHGEAEREARAAALSATERGVGLATVIEEEAAKLIRALDAAAIRNSRG
jgi:hypothetical protein